MKSLVVYYSRTNITEKLAKTIASRTDSDIEEIIPKVNYQGKLGYARGGKHAMQEKADTRKLKVYCETTVIGDMTSRPSPLIRNLARQMITREWCIMETTERDTLEELYEVKRSISSSFETYEQFAEWLLSEQDAAKKDGVKFIAA